jgi:acetyl-CoA carboxylase alpha subunit
MYTRWTSHLKTEQEKENFKNEVLSAKSVLERLTQMIDEDVNQLEKSENDQRVYSIPNWSHLQAHKNGNRQSYATIRQMIDLDQQKRTTD